MVFDLLEVGLHLSASPVSKAKLFRLAPPTAQLIVLPRDLCAFSLAVPLSRGIHPSHSNPRDQASYWLPLGEKKWGRYSLQSDGKNAAMPGKIAPESLLLMLRFRGPGTSVKTAKCPKVLQESAKSVFGLQGWESQSCLLQDAEPCFRLLSPVPNRVCTVRETLLRLSAQRPQITLSTLLKYLLAFCFFWHLHEGHTESPS